MKRVCSILLPVLILLLVCGYLLYHSVGWFRGDPLDYLKEHAAPDGSAIVSGEYLASGEDEDGGFVLYQVVTEDGKTHTIRIHVAFRRSIGRIGPDYKIKGFREVDAVDLPVHP